ncbi:hypothetical protein DL764_009589 [Monosporascus ibericus]|uniref:Uncharacterized protein n=1 Tax=Monosporascus ibericus TaxID=155417 RepID=A0A4Q4SUK1_9PEZI|nr:hypothetical protein DL764_009589 [Monosporascus ibericus]
MFQSLFSSLELKVEDAELDFSEEQQGLVDQDILLPSEKLKVKAANRARAGGCQKARPTEELERERSSVIKHIPDIEYNGCTAQIEEIVVRLMEEMGRDQLTQIPDIDILPNVSDIPDGIRSRTSTKRKASPGRGHKRTLSVGVTIGVALRAGQARKRHQRALPSPPRRSSSTSRAWLAVATLRYRTCELKRDGVCLVEGLDYVQADPLNRILSGPAPAIHSATSAQGRRVAHLTGNPGAALVYAVAAAKKQLAEALVLHEQGILTKDYALPVQGVIGKGVGAPLDVYAGAGATATAAASAVAVAVAARSSSPWHLKAFLEKLHAAVVASTTEEGEEGGKGEVAGGLLIGISVPPAAPAAITPRGCLRFRVRRQQRESRGGMDVAATTTSNTAAPMAIEWIYFEPDSDEGLHFRRLFRPKLQKAVGDFKAAKRKAGKSTAGGEEYDVEKIVDSGLDKKKRTMWRDQAHALEIIRKAQDAAHAKAPWSGRAEPMATPTTRKGGKSSTGTGEYNVEKIVNSRLSKRSEPKDGPHAKPSLRCGVVRIRASEEAAANDNQEAPAGPATQGRQAAPKKPLTRSMSGVTGAASLKRRRGVETGARSRPVRAAAEAAKPSWPCRMANELSISK